MEYISEIFIEEISKRASSSMQAAGVWGFLSSNRDARPPDHPGSR